MKRQIAEMYEEEKEWTLSANYYKEASEIYQTEPDRNAYTAIFFLIILNASEITINVS